jgi:cytochrome c oxidase subunit 3
MATTLHEPPKIDPHHPTDAGQSGNGGWQNLVPADGSLRAIEDHSSAAAKTGIWVGLAAITMSFAAFTSALIVRQGSATDWRHIALPPILYLNTLVLLGSGVTLEIARRRVASYARGTNREIAVPLSWLGLTLALGLLFVAGQYAAWLRLKSQGLYLATNPTSSFFYVLTAVHALHVTGGLGGLINVIGKLIRSVLRRSTLDATAYYWHFMGVLWLYLLLLLWMKF